MRCARLSAPTICTERGRKPITPSCPTPAIQHGSRASAPNSSRRPRNSKTGKLIAARNVFAAVTWRAGQENPAARPNDAASADTAPAQEPCVGRLLVFLGVLRRGLLAGGLACCTQAFKRSFLHLQ